MQASASQLSCWRNSLGGGVRQTSTAAGYRARLEIPVPFNFRRRSVQMAKRPAAPAPAPQVLTKRWWQRLPSLPGVETTSSSLRTVIINIALLLVLAMVIPLTVTQFSRDQILVQPLSVPGALEATGLTPAVAANRLWDGLEQIKQEGGSAKSSVNVIPEGQKVTFAVPDAGVSLDSLIYYARQFFNLHETVVSGEFRCGDASCAPAQVSLRLRVYGKVLKVIDLPPMRRSTEAEYWRKASLALMGVLDPFTALATEADSNPITAAALARQLIVADHPDAKWAHNILGNIRRNAGLVEEAIVEYQAALAMDANFVPALANLAGAYSEAKRTAEGTPYLERLKKADPNGPLAPEIEGDLARQAGQLDRARDLYLEAFRRDPLKARYQAKAAIMLFDAGRIEEAVAIAEDALGISPAASEPLAILGSYYGNKGDFAAVERIYRGAAEFAPEDAAIQIMHADLMVINRDYPGALQRFDQAVLNDDGNASYRIKRGQVLALLGRHADALADLEVAKKLDPTNAQIDYERAKSLLALGDQAASTAAYKAYVAAAPEGLYAEIAKAFIRNAEGAGTSPTP
jgi:tetratricopeptide (TPR) repeat protein